MKPFEDYKDGDWVTYSNPKSNWDQMQFQVYPSKYTNNAFRLKHGDRELIADISEITPLSNDTPSRLPTGMNDSDADSSGLYYVED